MVFEGYCIIFMICGDIFSSSAIFYAKNIMYFWLQSHWYIQCLINGFYVLLNKDKKMVVSKQISDYFTKLLEPFVTT